MSPREVLCTQDDIKAETGIASLSLTATAHGARRGQARQTSVELSAADKGLNGPARPASRTADGQSGLDSEMTDHGALTRERPAGSSVAASPCSSPQSPTPPILPANAAAEQPMRCREELSASANPSAASAPSCLSVEAVTAVLKDVEAEMAALAAEAAAATDAAERAVRAVEEYRAAAAAAKEAERERNLALEASCESAEAQARIGARVHQR